MSALGSLGNLSTKLAFVLGSLSNSSYFLSILLYEYNNQYLVQAFKLLAGIELAGRAQRERICKSMRRYEKIN